MKRAIITGATGQDGAYLIRMLRAKGYEVFGTYRHTGTPNLWRINELGLAADPQVRLLEHDLTSLPATVALIEAIQPTEIYNLAALSSVASSFADPYSAAQLTGIGTLNLLEAIRLVDPRVRYYQASTSEMFGNAQTVPQTEETPFLPCSPYGVAKLNAHWLTVNYRESYGIFGSCGILFNHESPLRTLDFVTRKISHGAVQIALGRQEFLEIGNLDARRDWGYAAEYVEGMWRMLQHDTPDTFILATNRAVSVRDFVNMAFNSVGIVLEFHGRGETETAIVTDWCAEPPIPALAPRTGTTVLRVAPRLFRPVEIRQTIGDPSKARAKLEWQPLTQVEQVCAMMVEADLHRCL